VKVAEYPAMRAKTAMQGIAPTLQTANQKQARPLDVEVVASIRGHINGSTNTMIKAAETMAIVQLISDSELRRSELATLT